MKTLVQETRTFTVVGSGEAVQNVLFGQDITFDKVKKLYGESCTIIDIKQVWIPGEGWRSVWPMKNVYTNIKDKISNAAFEGAQVASLMVYNRYGEVVFPDFQLSELTNLTITRE